MEIVLKNGDKFRYHIPAGSYLTPKELENGLQKGIIRLIKNKYKERIAKAGAGAESSDRPKRAAVQTERVETDAQIKPNPRVDETIQLDTDGKTSEEVGPPKSVVSPPPPTKKPAKTDEVIIIDDTKVDDPMAQHASDEWLLFKDYPELLERYKNKPNSLGNLLKVMRERVEKEGKRTRLHHENELLGRRKQIAIQAAGGNEELQAELMTTVKDEYAFYKKLVEKGLTKADPTVHEKLAFEDYSRYLRWFMAVRIHYFEDISRFSIAIEDDRIDYLEMSPQVAYALGFESSQLHSGDIARYSTDLRGGQHV